jgi:hypothetical protein
MISRIKGGSSGRDTQTWVDQDRSDFPGGTGLSGALDGIPDLPFEIRIRHADGDHSMIPCEDLEQVSSFLRAIFERAGDTAPEVELWRLDRAEPRPLIDAEIEEAGWLAA